MVGKAAAAAGAVVAGSDLARLLTREHGKVLWEAQFDAGTIGGMAGAFAPLVAEALAPRYTHGRRGPADHRRVRPLRGGGLLSCPSTGPSRCSATRSSPPSSPGTRWW